MSTVIQGVGFTLSSGGQARLVVPDGVLKPALWSDATGDELPASKQQVMRVGWTNFNLAIGGTPAAREELVYVAGAAGVINKFAALLNDTGTSTDVDFVLKKNGATLMSADLTITHALADRTVVAGTLSSVAYAAGDVFSIELVATSATGAQGPFAWAEFLESLS